MMGQKIQKLVTPEILPLIFETAANCEVFDENLVHTSVVLSMIKGGFVLDITFVSNYVSITLPMCLA